MLESITSISWKTYITVTAIAVAIYYIIILSLYYRQNIRKLMKGRQDLEYEIDQSGEGHFSSFEELEELVEEIRHSILEQAGKEANKTDLLKQISERVANYDGLRQPAYRIALNNFIIQHAESICGVTFSEEELDERWERLPR